MSGTAASSARVRAQRMVGTSRRMARATLAAGLIWSTLAAAAPLFGQNTPARTTTAPTRTAAPAAAPTRVATATAPTATPTTGNELKVLAVVNGEQIGRQELATECLRRYGEEVLETLVNRQVIMQACQQRGVNVTERDVEDEITRLAKKFKIPKDRWLAMLLQERGISEEQYRQEIMWPTLALRALAANKLDITDDDMRRAFESEFGAKVKVRIITVKDQGKAKDIHAQVVADPSRFGEYAKNLSEDPNSASAHGLIPPVAKHVGDPEIERVVFSLKEGEVSPVLFVGGRYHILKCDKHLPETLIPKQNLEHAREMIYDKLHDEKLREASSELFQDLQQKAQVVNVYNDPQLRAQYPGVAAQINGKPLTIAYLSEECIIRHGQEVLEGEINRKILTQELRRKKQQVTQEDIDQEIDRAAKLYGYVKADGTADLVAWQKSLEQNDGATVDLYIRDAVWPTVALKKLVGPSVKVDNADMEKGFEANYGERVEVLAIVVNEHREAQKVWEMARELPNDTNFGKLAEQYSIDPISRGNGGRVPPIRMHSGQPILEKAAFEMKPGELSGIIVIEDKYVILRCVGRTRPIVTDFNAVKDELYNDLLEKKMRVAMAREFEAVKEAAQVDNFLAGTSQDGKRFQGPDKLDASVKPASATRPVTAPRVGSRPTTKQ